MKECLLTLGWVNAPLLPLTRKVSPVQRISAWTLVLKCASGSSPASANSTSERFLIGFVRRNCFRLNFFFLRKFLSTGKPWVLKLLPLGPRRTCRAASITGGPTRFYPEIAIFHYAIRVFIDSLSDELFQRWREKLDFLCKILLDRSFFPLILAAHERERLACCLTRV